MAKIVIEDRPIPPMGSGNHLAVIAGRGLHIILKFTAPRVHSGELTYYQGVVKGLYQPLGKGDFDVKSIVLSLVKSGYNGWFVLERELVVNSEAEAGGWPFSDGKASAEFLHSVVESI